VLVGAGICLALIDACIVASRMTPTRWPAVRVRAVAVSLVVVVVATQWAVERRPW